MTPTYVRVRVGAEAYALPVDSVVEVAELGEVAAVPGASAVALGVRNLRGRVLPVFDLATVLGLESPGRPGRLLVADHGGRQVGLAVEDITNVSALAGDAQDADSDLLTCAVLADGDLVGVVDVERLFAAIGAR